MSFLSEKKIDFKIGVGRISDYSIYGIIELHAHTLRNKERLLCKCECKSRDQNNFVPPPEIYAHIW